MTLPPTPDPALAVTDLRAIIDSSADCIKVLDLNARLLSMNAGGMETMEITDFSVCHNLLWPSFWEGEARAQVELALDAARAGQTTTFEGPARTFAGTPKWWEVRVSPLRAPDGTVTRLLASSRDITARKRTEQQLLEAQHQLRNHAQALEVRVEQRERALEAFVHFTTQVASSTDLNDIATAASDIIRDAVGGAISGFYLVKGERAYPVMFSRNTPPEVIAARRAGIALTSPLVADALARRGTSFIGGEDGRLQSVGYASALSITAYHQGDQPYALFATGSQRTEWTAQEQAIIESVGRGLGLVLERTRQTQQLQERTAGLDSFVAFSEASSTTTDILVLARAAVDVLETTLRVVSVAYYALDGDLWKARVWSENFTPEVVAVLTASIPVDAPSYAEALQTRQAVFVPGWSADSEGVAQTEAFGAGAFYPCFVGESPHGLLAIGTQRAGDWTPRERAVFSAVGRSLTLALERAARTQELTVQRDALAARTEELMAANEELDAFTYSASHDLRTPIRHVMGFADLARAALVKNQPEKISHNLDIIQQGAMRMNGLIDGMLMLSRAGRQDFHPRMFPLEPLIVQAQQDAQLEFPEQVIDVRFQGSVIVWGDATLIQQVLTNLISNAVKYSTRREVSEVTVQVGETETEWTITVRDNGVGFDPRYGGKLFGIFQRLHTQDAFPGIGVGLATVRRIALKHGGRVFADGVVDRGATFGVALPKPVV
ncbi:histidine kinase [Deinococcus saxicola]|uniref:PAS domain-containing sensor histidine kinase n=1 Tax=Deinococcus saxicola TaxID=249406 RepID=UPI0039EE7B93